MTQVDHTVGVCLYQLDAREEAVLKRVVTFSGAQGRNYVLADLAAAQLVVVSNQTTIDLDAMHPQGAMLIRITDQDSEQPYDVLMQRPLLVTRVMRTLDEARKLWGDRVAAVSKASGSVHLTVVEPVIATPVVQVALPVVTPQTAITTELIESVSAQADVLLVPTVVAPSIEPTVVAVTESVVEAELPAPPAPVQAEVVEAPVAQVLVQSVPVSTPSAELPIDRGVEYHHCALVVDDSAAIRKQLELELRQAGIASDFAETGEEALQKIASHTYDLVFLDIIMPGIDGYETCRQMRMRKDMKKTPIIMLSAKTSPLDEVQGVIAGASTYLTKPVKSDQLQKTLKRVAMWLDNFQQARS